MAKYTSTASDGDLTHQAISSYFIGPQAENLKYFQKNLDNILQELSNARQSYMSDDGPFITESIQNSAEFKRRTESSERAIQKAAQLLGKHSIPFWSPRYQAHMCMDMSTPALLGYFMTMIYNPNNVALEASPMTTIAEIEVGKQLCDLFGYNINPENQGSPTAWGHVTCDGTVANLESIWVARNLKFYPLSLRNAMTEGQGLHFVSDSFTVQTCQGKEKLYKDLSTWELLNLKPHVVLDLPDRLNKEYGISSTFLENVMTTHTIQSTGKDTLERQSGIDKPIQYMLSNTRHYSWPKGGAIAGIGSDNIVGIKVDNGARVDIKALDSKLQESLDKEQPVYAVVAIIGSTEEGAVDPLGDILALRAKYQAKGLSFVVHADAAWGGYFCTMLPKNYHPGDVLKYPSGISLGDGFVPDAGLRAQTQEDLYAMRFADSITVDPHKAGYIPYPAGGLCYRDERMRFLVTWTSPYLSRGSVTSIGIFGVEGSKPGASAMSAFLSNACIGLDEGGYGALLGEVTFTCSRLSAEWAAMTTEDMPFTVVPFNMLPSELAPDSTAEAVEAEKKRIRDQILSKTNLEIAQEDLNRPADEKAMKLLRGLGSDLNINAFAINWRYSDGLLNTDVEEANYLMQRVVERLSVDSPEDDPTQVPLYLTSTEFSHDLYGDCATNFKKRLGLREDDQTALFVLRNVVMSPWPTEGNFISKLADIFKTVCEEEVEVCRKRNETKEDYHNFLMQGSDQVYLVHYPMFHLAKHRRQLIVSVDIGDPKSDYQAMKKASAEPLTLVTQTKLDLDDVLKSGGSFKGDITSRSAGKVIPNVNVKINRVIKDRLLNSMNRDAGYLSEHVPFYLYGSQQEPHIDHILVRSPNIQLSAENVKLTFGDEAKDVPVFDAGVKLGGFSAGINLSGHTKAATKLTDEQLADGVVLYLKNVNEASMQPFPSTQDLAANQNFFFRPGKSFDVDIYRDAKKPGEHGPGLADAYKDEGNKIVSGKLTLGKSVYVDSEDINKDPFKRVDPVSKWQKEFEKIGRELE